MIKIKLSRSNFIHLLRWTAALLVVFNHLRSIMFKDFNLIKHKGVLTQLFYLITSFGHQAVVVFFVLSGYLVAGSVINQLKKDNFDIKMYFINRFSRLYSVLFVALLLTIVLDHIGIYFDKVSLYNDGIKTATLGFSIANRLSLKYFLTSLFMLQTIVLPPLGSNSPLWSLSFEFWYYIIFPCCCLIFVYSAKKNKLIIAPLIAIIIIGAFLPNVILLYFVIWLIGLIPFYLTLNKAFYKYILFFLFVSMLILKKAIHFDGFYYDLVLGLIVALWISSYDSYYQSLNSRSLKINEKLSSFSYSTYLVHFPVIMLVLTLIRNYTNTGIWAEPSFKMYLIFLIVSLFVLICSYSVASITEFKTSKFREFIKNLVGQKEKL